MIKKIKDLNDALPGLMLNIVFIGILCEVIGVCFVRDRLGYSIGLWMGIMVAEARAFHMAWALNATLELDIGGAQKKALMHNLIRYALVILVILIIAKTEMANPWAAFLGIMSLKAAAYLQPFTHKLYTKITKRI